MVAAESSTAPVASTSNGTTAPAEPRVTFMLDNYDSFTYNLYQYLCLAGANVVVARNDAITIAEIEALNPRNVVISPGPGHPTTDSGISRELIKTFAGRVPILGVCMGMQCMFDAFGGEVSHAGEIIHGKTSQVKHDGRGLFRDVPQDIPSTRYHSLAPKLSTFPPELALTATTAESGVVMGLRHRKYTVEGVQYHPESILSEGGRKLMENFLALEGGTWAENPAFGVSSPTKPPPALASTKGVSSSSKLPTILDKIQAQRLVDVATAKASPGKTPADLRKLLELSLCPPQISFVDRVRADPLRPAVMAEVKRASPSKGLIAGSANAAEQALAYARAGASVISVLTEPTWFKGSLDDMRLAREAVATLPNRPAILRKDFILDTYQIDEARLYGADSVLLIVAMLAPEQLKALHTYALGLGIEPLVEVNNAKEMEVALELGARVIGVNNRNLHDFEVDMGTTSRLADMVKGRDVTLCALSGITGRKDVEVYIDQGVGAVLVGEALMRSADPKAFIHELLGVPAAPSATTTSSPSSAPLVKICGLSTVKDALVAKDAGADFLGLIFAEKSKRRVTLAQAQVIAAAVCQGARSTASEPAPVSRTATWFEHHAASLAAASSARPLLVGVFQNQPLETILATAAAVPLDLVQLHGSEPAEWARLIPVPVIRVFHVSDDGAGLRDVHRVGYNAAVLLDTATGKGTSGGAGHAFDWSVAEKVRQPFVLAGGLDPTNVREAVEKVRPWAVDVSSGVETDGVKDEEKIRALLKAAKGTA